MSLRKKDPADLAAKQPKPAVGPERDSAPRTPRASPQDPDVENNLLDEPDLPEGEPSGAPTQNTKERLPGER